MPVWDLLNKKKYLSKNEQHIYNARISTCNKCPLLTKLRTCGDGIKSGCGCFIDAKAKLSAEKCPEGKW